MSGRGKVVPFPNQRAFPWGRAPAFDPANPRHVEAWQTLYETGMVALRLQEAGR